MRQGLLDQTKFLGQLLVLSYLLLHVGIQLIAGHGERIKLAALTQLGEVFGASSWSNEFFHQV